MGAFVVVELDVVLIPDNSGRVGRIDMNAFLLTVAQNPSIRMLSMRVRPSIADEDAVLFQEVFPYLCLYVAST